MSWLVGRLRTWYGISVCVGELMYVLVLTRTKPKQSSLQGFSNQSFTRRECQGCSSACEVWCSIINWRRYIDE